MGRYSVYDIMGETVSFRCKAREAFGKLEDVSRDILGNQIRMKVGGKEFCFDEPTEIEEVDGGLVFVYGRESQEDSVEFCGEDVHARWGEDLRKSINRRCAITRIPIKVIE